jgi:hypothetical protein
MTHLNGSRRKVRAHPKQYVRVRTVNIFIVLLVAVFAITACQKDDCIDDPCAAGCSNCPGDPCDDPCANPAACPGMCDEIKTGFTEDDLKATGEITETSGGYTLKGSLELQTGDNASVVLSNADLEVTINADGTVGNISGKAEIPSPSNHFEFADPVQGAVGMYTGKFINDNMGFDILLKDEINYFVFYIEVALELKVGANNNTEDTKPISIKPPVGGKIVFIADYNDPMFYFSAAQDALGSLSMGYSIRGQLPFVPLQPVEKLVAFDGMSYRGGSFSVFKVIDVEGYTIRNVEFDAGLAEEDPFPLQFNAGFAAGINGAFNLSLPIATFISFGIPMGEASAAVVAEAGTGGAKGVAFLNGLAEPDNSWWPDFVPVKPGGSLRASGYVDQTSLFDLALEGEFNIQLPSTSQGLEGAARVTNEAFTLDGGVTVNDALWQAGITFKKDETELAAQPPEAFMGDIDGIVTEEIDSAFNKVDQKLAELQQATADYELELSLRGLRSALPAVIQKAKETIADAIDAGIASGRKQANDELSKRGLALCGDNIASVVRKVDDPYISALNKLLAAVEDTKDNAQTRIELEAALRNLAALNKIDKTVTVTVTAGNKKTLVVPKCTFTENFTRKVTIKATVLTSEQVAQLNQAADNVQYIQETSDLVIAVQEILDRLPSKDELAQLKGDIQNGTVQIPEIGEAGFVYDHSKKSFSFFLVVAGERKPLAGDNPFDPGALAETIYKLML